MGGVTAHYPNYELSASFPFPNAGANLPRKSEETQRGVNTDQGYAIFPICICFQIDSNLLTAMSRVTEKQVLECKISNQKLVTESVLRGMFSTQRVSTQLKANTKAPVDEVSKIRSIKCTHAHIFSPACKLTTHSTEGHSVT